MGRLACLAAVVVTSMWRRSRSPAGVVSCAQPAQIPGGRCPAGALTAAFPACLFRNL
jgi:hypothetical protein